MSEDRQLLLSRIESLEKEIHRLKNKLSNQKFLAKLAVIHECGECPHCNGNFDVHDDGTFDSFNFCEKMNNRPLENIFEVPIPEWCPLPNAEEDNVNDNDNEPEHRYLKIDDSVLDKDSTIVYCSHANNICLNCKQWYRYAENRHNGITIEKSEGYCKVKFITTKIDDSCEDFDSNITVS